MVEKYRLQYDNRRDSVLAINWAQNEAHEKRPYRFTRGDCRVLGIKESTDVDKHNLESYQHSFYSEPMTLDEVRDYVANNPNMLGRVHDCVGLVLGDSLDSIDFKEPIVVRNGF